MKILLLTLAILTFSSHAKLIDNTQDINKPINIGSIDYIKSLKKSNRVGNGSISGILVEQDTGNPIDDSAQLIISLIGRSDENSQWESIDSQTIINSQYDFINLDSGQYYLVVDTGYSNDQEDRPLYVTKFWVITCFNEKI